MGRVLLVFLTLAVAAAAALAPTGASAYPFFTRQVGRDCAFCHNAYPKLNDTGRTFLYNGYRFEAEGEWREVKDLSSVPVSFEVEIEGLYDDIRRASGWEESSDIVVEEAEVIAGGAFGKSGRVSALVAVTAAEQSDGTFKTSVPKAFVQFNDLAGSPGSGSLNLKAGIGDIGIPFLHPAATPIANRTLAETLLGILDPEERFIEVNGSYSPESDSRAVTHRYRAGFSREEVDGSNTIKGVYAAWSATIDEWLSLGAVARLGEEASGGADHDFARYGAGVEAELGPVVASFAYFMAANDGAPDAEDWLAEALYFRGGLTLGGRYEQARLSGRDSAKSQTLMARYNILTNAYAQVELRRLDDPDRAAGGGDTENKARLMLVALF